MQYYFITFPKQPWQLNIMIFNGRNILAAVLFLSSLIACTQENESNLDYVDPSIGGVGVILQPTRPTVHLPNSMVRVFPNRKDQLDDQISNFQLTITSHRLYKVFAFMPVCGIVDSNIWDKRYEYSTEILTPYYYK
ncbi:Alpha-1,2-mannosidase, partial [hydrothermal vent metagenome]